MNTKLFNRFTGIVAILILAVILLPMCKNPLDGFKAELNSNISSATLSIMVTNANPNATEQMPKDVQISFTGAGAARLFEVSGSKDFTLQNGIINLILINADKPTADKPVLFNVNLSAPGFMDVTYLISIGDTGQYSYQIPMVELNNAPEGVAVVVNKNHTLDNSGTVPSKIEIETPSVANKPENVKVTINPGTIMRDADGNPVTGNISIEMAHHDNRAFESVNSFPGGFFADNVIDENGNPMDPVTFQTLGLINLEIKAGDKKVKTFSEPIIASVELNETSINPNTGVAIKEGDSVPIWSRDQDNGQWKLEGYELITKDPVSGKLVTVMKITHLSPWNIDWFWWSWWSWSPWPRCSQPFVTVNSNRSGWVYYELVDQWGGWIDWGSRYLWQGSNRFSFNAQSGRNARLRIYNNSNWWNRGAMISQSNQFSLCGGSSTMSVNLPQPVTINVNFQANCPSGRIIRPTFDVYYREPNGWWSYLGTMRNGNLTTFSLELNKTYIFGVNYGGVWYEYQHIINKTVFNEVLTLRSTDFACK